MKLICNTVILPRNSLGRHRVAGIRDRGNSDWGKYVSFSCPGETTEEGGLTIQRTSVATALAFAADSTRVQYESHPHGSQPSFRSELHSKCGKDPRCRPGLLSAGPPLRRSPVGKKKGGPVLKGFPHIFSRPARPPAAMAKPAGQLSGSRYSHQTTHIASSGVISRRATATAHHEFHKGPCRQV